MATTSHSISQLANRLTRISCKPGNRKWVQVGPDLFITIHFFSPVYHSLPTLSVRPKKSTSNTSSQLIIITKPHFHLRLSNTTIMQTRCSPPPGTYSVKEH